MSDSIDSGTAVDSFIAQLQVKEAARSRLAAVLPHIRAAAVKAASDLPTAKLMLGVLAVNADGSGKLTASFDLETFLDDLETLLGSGGQVLQ